MGILAIFLFSLGLGTVSLSAQEFKKAFFSPNSENLASTLIWNVRMPRFVLAMFAGGVLSLAGQGMQFLVRNPLADPYTMGTASGASLGVNLALSGWIPGILSAWFLVPFWAFSGALTATVLVLALSAKRGGTDPVRFVLTGVAVSMLTNSALSLLTYLAARQSEVRHMLFWAFGNLDKASWSTLGPVLGMSVIPLILFFVARKAWPFLLLGDEKADSLGVSTSLLRKTLLVLCSLLTALVVCLAGPLGFVGLVVPYWIRKWLPLTDAWFWPLTFVLGAFFLTTCDFLSRILFPPYGLPVGLLTSLVGLPFFLYLLRDSSARQGQV
jgi:iron complex transport system permease protein